MEPRPSSLSDKLNSPKPSPSSRTTTPKTEVCPPLVSTIWPTGPLLSTRSSSVTSTSSRPPKTPPSSMSPTSPTPSTGSPRVPSPQSRTKDNAVHAGLSPPPVPSRALCSSRPASSNPSPSNNSSIAIRLTKAATVVLWTTPSNISRRTHFNSNPLVLLPSKVSPTFPHPPPNSRPPSPRPQSPSPSRPTNPPSNSTPVVSSPADAVANSTTVSSPSDMVPNPEPTTSSSRTPGAPHGVLTVMLRWPHPNAESPLLPLTQLSDLSIADRHP